MNSFRFDRLSRMFYFLIMICSFLLFPDYVFAEESNGWVEINEYRYYYQDGVMLQACLREIEGTVYYFLEDGRMLDCNDEASLTDENGSVYYVRAMDGGALYIEEWYTVPESYPKIRYYYGDNGYAVQGPYWIEEEYYLFSDHGMLLRDIPKYEWNDKLWHTDEYGRLLEGVSPDYFEDDPDNPGDPDDPDNPGDPDDPDNPGNPDDPDNPGDPDDPDNPGDPDDPDNPGDPDDPDNPGDLDDPDNPGDPDDPDNPGDPDNPDIPERKNGWYEETEGKKYYINNKTVSSCLVQIDGKFYCFDDNCCLIVDRTAGVQDSNGIVRSIRAKEDGSLYQNEVFLDPYSGAAYYYGTDCLSQYGFYTYPDGQRYFFANGRMAAGECFQDGEDYFYADENGNIHEGRFYDEEGNVLCNICVVSGNMLFGCHETGAIERIMGNGFFQKVYGYRAVYLRDSILVKNEFVDIAGRQAYFGENGNLQTGLFFIEGVRHLSTSDGQYLGTAELEGWNIIHGEKYYIKNGALFSEGPHQVDWKTCWFNADGMLMHDCLYQNIQLDADGHQISNGWVNRPEGRYYVNPNNGEIIRSSEFSIENQNYYFDADGLMVTGKIYVNGEEREYGEDGVLLQNPFVTDIIKEQEKEDDPDKDYIPQNEKNSADSGTSYDSRSTIATVGNHPAPQIGASVPTQNNDTDIQREGADPKRHFLDEMHPGLYVYRYGVWVHKETNGSPIIILCFSHDGKHARQFATGEVIKNTLLITKSNTLYFDENGLLSSAGIRRIGDAACRIRCNNGYPDQTIMIFTHNK